MTASPESTAKDDEIHTGNSPAPITNHAVYAYNMDENKTPGGLKVRVKIRVITGPEKARLDARQAEAIRELLTWARQHTRSTTSR